MGLDMVVYFIERVCFGLRWTDRVRDPVPSGYIVFISVVMQRVMEYPNRNPHY